MIVWDNGTKKQRVYEIWEDNFHDPVSYANFYFNEVYGKNEVLLNEEMSADENLVKGMLHLNPYTLHVKGQPAEAKYIVGVATDEEYRRQGVMRELLVKTFQELRSRGELFTYLMPADENYYLPFDFRFGMAQVEQELEYLPELRKETEKQAKDIIEKDSKDSIDAKQESVAKNKEVLLKKEEVEQESQPEECPIKEDILGDNKNKRESSFEKYTFKTELSDAELETLVAQENVIKDTLFDIFTEISVPYIRRMEKEVESDYGQVIYVFDGESYVGRAAVGAEDSYFVLSQVFCADASKRENFLEQVILYCEEKYHYNRYQLILDPSWKDITTKIGLYRNFRFMPAKRVKKIMFRLLNIEELSKFLECKIETLKETSETEKEKAGAKICEADNCGTNSEENDVYKSDNCENAICEIDNCEAYTYREDIYIEDKYLEEQSGAYHFLLKNGKVSITKTETIKTDGMQSISIAALTDYLFGKKEESVDNCETLTEEGKMLLKNICPLSENCIMEIV